MGGKCAGILQKFAVFDRSTPETRSRQTAFTATSPQVAIIWCDFMAGG
jgi:hypothetical protein